LDAPDTGMLTTYLGQYLSGSAALHQAQEEKEKQPVHGLKISGLEKRNLVTEKIQQCVFTSKMTCTRHVCTTAYGNLLRAVRQVIEKLMEKIFEKSEFQFQNVRDVIFPPYIIQNWLDSTRAICLIISKCFGLRGDRQKRYQTTIS
jgi:hypothetical protein